MLVLVWRARAKVIRRRWGETITAPIPETFSWERARTQRVGVIPRRPQVRRSTGAIRKPVSSRHTRCAPSRWSFFYARPLDLHPLTDAAVVSLLGDALRALRGQATGPQEPADVIGMVGDPEASSNELDDPPTGPEPGRIARSFRAL